MNDPFDLRLHPLIRVAYLIAGISVICLFTAACQRAYPDISSQLSVRTLTVDLTDRNYGGVTWLSSSELAFVASIDPNDPLSKDTVVVFDMDESTWREISLPPKTADCFNNWWSGVLSRLPDGNLGLVEYCATEPSGFRETLYRWESDTDELNVLQTYPRPFAVGRYAFSEDMSELVQEKAEGPYLSEKLFQFNSDGAHKQLVPQFQRAKSPSLSADGQTIAFVGTESYPGGNPDDFNTWPQIEDLVRYPYDLYFMGADGENVRLVVTGLENSWTPKWSPTNENLLAIGGSVKGQQGLWLYNRETLELQFLWSSPSFSYDWSPDGSKIVVLEYVDPNKDGFRESSEARIIEVPES